VARWAMQRFCCSSAMALQAAYDGTASGAGGGRSSDMIALVAAAMECCSVEGCMEVGRCRRPRERCGQPPDDGAGGDGTAEWQHAQRALRRSGMESRMFAGAEG
jgi:hypothetical protein